jgi:hypothetical protein
MQSLVASLSFVWATQTTVARAQDSRRDGNWWRTLPAEQRLFYIIGFMDGLHTGKNWTVVGMLEKKDMDACYTIGSNSFTSMETKYLTNPTAGQIRDGINEFYEDYRNRGIVVAGGFWIVLQSIAGLSKDKIEATTELWRKSPDN